MHASAETNTKKKIVFIERCGRKLSYFSANVKLSLAVKFHEVMLDKEKYGREVTFKSFFHSSRLHGT